MTTIHPGSAGSVDLFPRGRSDASIVRTAVVVALVLHALALLAPIVVEVDPPPPPSGPDLPRTTRTVLPPPERKVEVPRRVRATRTDPVPVPRDFVIDEVEEAAPQVAIDESSWELADETPTLLGEPELPDLPDRVTIGTPGLDPPVLIHKVAPAFPELARRVRREGTVILSAVVDRAGRVVEIRVVSAPNPDLGFSRQAIEAVESWVYEPGRLGDRPIPVSLTIEVTFTLN